MQEKAMRTMVKLAGDETHTLSLRMPKSLHKKLKEKSEQSGATINYLIVDSISQMLGRKGKANE